MAIASKNAPNGQSEGGWKKIVDQGLNTYEDMVNTKWLGRIANGMERKRLEDQGQKFQLEVYGWTFGISTVYLCVTGEQLPESVYYGKGTK